MKTKTKEIKPKNLIQAIERMSAILNVLAKNSKGASLGKIAEIVDLPKGTVHHILSTLVYLQYARQAPDTRLYSLGFKLVDLGNTLLDQIDLRKEAEPFLHELSRKTGETVYMVIIDKTEVVYIDRIDPEDSSLVLKTMSKVGQRNSAYACAVGKALLAELPEEELDELIKDINFVRKTGKTISDPVKFKDHLKKVHTRGYAIDDEESEEGIRCAAAPIYNESGKAISAISISGPAIRLTLKRINDSLKDEVRQTALEISRRMGYRD